jgi:small redox-active disulfide protein 2
MAQDHTIFRVGGHDTGVMGLTDTMTSARERFGTADGDEVIDFLLQQLQRRNYIPQAARADYRHALLREYRRFLGKPCGDERAAETRVLKIQVVGAGCSQCDGLEHSVMGVLSELGLSNACVEHVRDLQTIAKMGIMGVPALVVAGEVKCAGSVPSRQKIRRWLEPYLAPSVAP